MELFLKKNETFSPTIKDGEILYIPNFKKKNAADLLLKKLENTIPWRQDKITVYGKTYDQPRLTSLHSIQQKPYSYSNITMHPRAMTNELLQILTEIEDKPGDLAKIEKEMLKINGFIKVVSNKIDIDKTIAFGELFRSSAKLQDDDDAYDALAQAVEDIRDILKSGGTAAASNAGGTGGSAGGSSSGENASLNITLRSLNRAIDSLPRKISTAVSSAEITVQPAP